MCILQSLCLLFTKRSAPFQYTTDTITSITFFTVYGGCVGFIRSGSECYGRALAGVRYRGLRVGSIYGEGWGGRRRDTRPHTKVWVVASSSADTVGPGRSCSLFGRQLDERQEAVHRPPPAAHRRHRNQVSSSVQVWPHLLPPLAALEEPPAAWAQIKAAKDWSHHHPSLMTKKSKWHDKGIRLFSWPLLLY